MKVEKKLIIGFFLFFILIALYSYRLVEGFNYDNDFGRDIYDILGIVRGNLRLLGPRLSFGGFISGPYYYYLFAIPLFLAKENPASLLYFSVFLYSLSFFVFYLFLNKKKGNFLPALLFILYLATSKYLLFSVRNPGNAFSYFWLIILFLILFLKKNNSFLKTHRKYLFLFLGFLAGAISNFHFVNLVIMAVFFMAWFVNEKKDIKEKLLFIFGGIISFLPQLLFEIRHGFVMLKNTFQAQSYLQFTSRSLPTTLEVSNNPILNLFLVNKYIGAWLQGGFWLILALGIFFYLKNSQKLKVEEKIIIQTSLFSYLLLLILARFQFAFHYFLPFVFLWQISLFWLIKKRVLKIVIFSFLLALNLYYFPRGFYKNAPKQLKNYENFVYKIQESGFVEKGDKYNIFVIRETPLAIAGWEYRYFLKKIALDPLSSFEYRNSDKMLIIAEEGRIIDLNNLNTWEFEQFGEYNVLKKGELEGRRMVLLEKNRKI